MREEEEEEQKGGRKEDEEVTMQMANRKMSKCSASIIIWKAPIKTTAFYHLTLAKMAITIKDKIQLPERVWKTDNSYKLVLPHGNSIKVSLKLTN